MKVLVVANRTASTPRLLEEVARRSRARPTEFVLLIPEVRNAADWTRETAVALLSRAARQPVDSLPAGADLLDALRGGDFDEIVISSKWLRRGLIRRVERLGLPMTFVNPTRPPILDAGVDLAPSICCSTRLTR